MKSTDISLDRQASSASVIRFEKLSRDNFSNRITDADEACRSSEISVDFIIIIVFL